MTEIPAIYGSLLAVQEGISNIPKNGHMKFGNQDYKYLKADDVQSAINPLLSQNKIIVKAAYTVEDSTKGNRAWVYVHLALSYVSAIDGSSFEGAKVVGECTAGDDKSINKALTQAIKNAHRVQFQFESGEQEPDDVKPKSETGNGRPQQAMADAKKRESKPVSKLADGEKASIQAEIKKLAESRQALDKTFSYMKFASKVEGVSGDPRWYEDAGKLSLVRDALANGEV